MKAANAPSLPLYLLNFLLSSDILHPREGHHTIEASGKKEPLSRQPPGNPENLSLQKINI
jgi:hypothetical protein